ncbi:hypothetical protein [Amycolatopsis sp. cmx-4-61]|uniref:hypothetical protein n=1 Tax=Amycolatopsis sp. cmx-4-61 TaxID=2790937 RepID=UPI00397B713A
MKPEPSVPAKTSRLQRAAAAWPGEPAGPGTSVSVIRPEPAPGRRRLPPRRRRAHVRREAAGRAPITQLWQADTLLNLPANLPVPLESLTERERRALHRLPPGAVEHDGMNLIRRARPTLTVTFALVSVQHWRTGLAAAGEYAPYCRRAMLLAAAPAEEEALLDASLYDIGVGLADWTGVRELMAPGPHKRLLVNAAHWTFTEQVLRPAPGRKGGMNEQQDPAESTLTSIATEAIDNASAADDRLADWIGRTPSPASEARMRQLAHQAPRLVADALRRSGRAQAYGDKDVRAALTDLPAAALAAIRAITRHIAGEADAADGTIDAFVAPRGVQGLWDVGAAGLRLLTEELRDQRKDPRQDEGSEDVIWFEATKRRIDTLFLVLDDCVARSPSLPSPDRWLFIAADPGSWRQVAIEHLDEFHQAGLLNPTDQPYQSPFGRPPPTTSSWSSSATRGRG